MTDSAQLESEAEQTRAQLAQTLDELRERITPGQLVDQAVDYAKDSGGGVFVRNLGGQVTGNPLPVALIGAGIAWLMLSNGRARASGGSKEAAIDRARRAAIDTAARAADVGRAAGGRLSEWANDTTAGLASAGQKARKTARKTAASAESAQRTGTQSLSGGAGEAMSRATEQASALGGAAYESAKATGADAYARLSDTASRASASMTDSVSSFGQRTADSTRNLLQFCKNEPLVLAGIGMALGAIVGALMPATETEDRLMGETSDQIKDQVKDQVRDFAEDQAETVKSAAKSAASAAAPAAAQAAAQAMQGEDEFQFRGPAAQSGPATEASLVPEAQHGSETQTSEPQAPDAQAAKPQASASQAVKPHTSDEPAEPQR